MTIKGRLRRRASSLVVNALLTPEAKLAWPWRVAYHPVFEALPDLVDQCYRASWYIPVRSGCEVVFPIGPRLSPPTRDELEKLRPTYMPELAPDIRHFRFVRVANRSGHVALLRRSRNILFWRSPGAWAAKLFPLFSPASSSRFSLVDRQGPRFDEAGHYASLLHRMLPAADAHSLVESSAGRFDAGVADLRLRFKRAYVFATGPSVQSVMSHDFSDGARVVCNTIVKNDQLLAHIRPHFIVAADSAYYFGCTRYADAFRRDLRRAVQVWDAWFVVPDICAPLLLANYPELEDRLLAIPYAYGQAVPNLDLAREFCVSSGKGSHHARTILQQLLVPLGSTLADDVVIAAADGRSKSSQRFWNHDPASQYVDLMETLEQGHPGYFAGVNFQDYYDQHCISLEHLLSYGESVGKHYTSLTPSLIPALQKRQVRAG